MDDVSSESGGDRYGGAQRQAVEGLCVVVVSDDSSASGADGSSKSLSGDDRGLAAGVSRGAAGLALPWRLLQPSAKSVDPHHGKALEATRCRCSGRCGHVGADPSVQRELKQLHCMPKDAQDICISKILSEARRVDQQGGRPVFAAFGHKLCLEGLQSLLGIGSHRFRRLSRGLPDMRSMPGARAAREPVRGTGSTESVVFSYLWSLYESVAEVLPMEDTSNVVAHTEPVKDDLLSALELLAVGDATSSAVRATIKAGLGKLPRKYLPPGRPKDYWYHMADEPGVPHPTPSYSSFKRVWRRHFRHLLAFHTFSKWALCDTCHLLQGKIQGAVNAADRVRWSQAYMQHQKDQRADRAVYYRMRGLSLAGQALTIMQDGSDQAKYRLVRVTKPPKSLDMAACPRVKLVGSLSHGFCSCFYFVEADVTHDANLTVECLMSCIEDCFALVSSLHLSGFPWGLPSGTCTGVPVVRRGLGEVAAKGPLATGRQLHRGKQK